MWYRCGVGRVTRRGGVLWWCGVGGGGGGGGGGIKVSHLPNALLTLAPPSDYDLNLEALIKVSKVSSTSQLSYEILKSSFERKFR